MRPRVRIEELKARLAPAVERWGHALTDEWAKGDPRLGVVAVYLKRGLTNLIEREGERLSQAVDRVALFLCDKDGNIDAGTVFDDAMSLLQQTEETPFTVGFLHGTLGAGTVRIEIPDSPLLGLLFGKTGAVKITQDDFATLRSMIVEKK